MHSGEIIFIIITERLRKTEKNISKYSRFQGRDFSPRPPEYETANHYTVTFSAVIVNYDFEMVGDEAVVVYFKVLSQVLTGGDG